MIKRKSPAKSSTDSIPVADQLGRELSTAVVLFHEAIAAHLGMSATEWKCLSLLDQHGPSTASRLAQLSGYTTGAITGIVDRLERAGYARREPHPNDRRSIMIHTSGMEQLRPQIMPIFASLARATGAIMTHFTPGELKAIQAYLEGMIQVLREQTAQLTTGRYTK